MPTVIKKLTQEHKDRLYGQTSSKELTLQVMQFKLVKVTHWLIHGLNHSPQPENIILLITTSTYLSWTLYSNNKDLLKLKEQLLLRNWLELLLITTIQTFCSMENSLSIFNKLEPVEITPQLQPTVKLSTGEEMIQSKRVLQSVEQIKDGPVLITLTGPWADRITLPLVRMPLLSVTMLSLQDQVIFI